jgi:hypothetical protein
MPLLHLSLNHYGNCVAWINAANRHPSISKTTQSWSNNYPVVRVHQSKVKFPFPPAAFLKSDGASLKACAKLHFNLTRER